jgi:hypothetical protein
MGSIVENQLSRYGAVSKSVPLTTGKMFFLVSPTEYALPGLQSSFPNDGSGVPRVYTTWASVISACQAYTDADVVIVSPLFTTAPTKAQQLQLDACEVVVWQAGENLPDGSYIAATMSAPSLATTTTEQLFQVNGRIELIDILGEVQTTTGATITAKFTNVPTVGSTTDLCATGNIAGLNPGAQMNITGTLATPMQTTTQSVFLKQAAGLILTAGTLQLTQSQTTTGNVKYRIRYKAIDPGAFVLPLI